MAELFRCAGTQFDPILVRQFVEMLEGDRGQLRKQVATRWLLGLDPQAANAYWDFTAGPAPAINGAASSEYVALRGQAAGQHVRRRGLRQFAGPHRRLEPRLRSGSRASPAPASASSNGIRKSSSWPTKRASAIGETECPVLAAINSGVQSLRRLTVSGRSGRIVAVDSHVIPVIGGDGTTQGAILILHDASSETSLEERCQSLADKATRDPLTLVANRAEFDRVHAMFVTAHQQQQAPCSLLMCDLDRFKLVNDSYGHQAGDEAIKCLAALLKGACHPGDFVARYGGEEFVVLLADCDLSTACRRAEQVRIALSQLPQPKMNGKSITVQFRRHRDPAGRHGRDHAPPRRPRLVDGQGKRPQPGRAARRRHERPRRRVRRRRRSRRPAANRRPSFSRRSSRPCPPRSPSRSSAASWPTTRRRS